MFKFKRNPGVQPAHDRSPVDNGTFTQKPAALKALDKMPNRKKLFLTRMAMQELTHG